MGLVTKIYEVLYKSCSRLDGQNKGTNKILKDRFWMSSENYMFVELLLKDNKWSIANIILSILFFWPSEMVLVFELFLVKNLMSFEFLSFNAQATRSK